MAGATSARRVSGSAPAISFDVIIVGAGFAGMYMLHRLRSLGLSAVVLEAAAGVGGTWFWNRYPGARCDVESMQYSYSFSEELQQEWRWAERYASQPEILAYANYVAKKFNLLPDIEFDTRVIGAVYREEDCRWLVSTDRGTQFRAKWCVMATGCLSAAQTPNIRGLDTFKGRVYHTGNWPHEAVNFSGQTVGVIGTGSSGIQVIPEIAAQAKHLYVFQRTPNFSVPARNRAMDSEYERSWKKNYAERRAMARSMPAGILCQVGAKSALAASPEERNQEFERRWAQGGTGLTVAYSDLLRDVEANETAAQFVRDKIRTVVENPTVAELLIPMDHPIGAKRICSDTKYFETFNRENVTLVDLRANPIRDMGSDGITAGLDFFKLNSLVLATGFDAITGALSKIDIVGRHGLSLREKWRDGPNTFLGLMSSGFPNLFVVTGPGSPSVLTNVIVAIEDNVEWIASCIVHLLKVDGEYIEATSSAEETWMEQVQKAVEGTLYPQAKSWYLGANIAGKRAVFLPYVGGLPTYQRICDEVAAMGYSGFKIGMRPT
ncbi:flavin-containing monooxygenase [Mesorhizobium loti]|uniref:Cyclohexanone monooxygenase n=1 Tax=Rhizobium loti TaxID=381 RepID=A0A1A5IFY1_RHILI|nr:NAD(P)/FAD-dependent oxidoreductase [Mesorhizobium loti]OBP77876.1 cyclohexanone monooxygenase [Mesorhizobium loti]OBQ69830.1 cyclohexanone monooxygenase [Mesorhizobium loti]QKC73212.1 NAD(P)/FAD-dependent oxidoreductase [Mesorhizobium loti]